MNLIKHSHETAATTNNTRQNSMNAKIKERVCEIAEDQREITNSMNCVRCKQLSQNPNSQQGHLTLHMAHDDCNVQSNYQENNKLKDFHDFVSFQGL